ncbi:MAG TPA: prepilin-type N-terminal cleavage/methylation domain-containing protein [Pirellulales bacterium]|jgi:prepilin-type N-terminal cleavage/methylation domain-containing protein
MQRPSPVRNSVIPHRPRSRPAPRPAFTLIEVLVAMAVTLMLMAIVVTIFGAIGENVSKNNSSMEMNDQLRSVKQRLQLDLAGVTVQMLPPRRDENGEGYFEIIEGPVGRLPPNTKFVIDETYDTTQAATASVNASSEGPDTTVGDTDDMLMFTTRSKGEMFQGRGAQWNAFTSQYDIKSLQSQAAEVAWFMRGTTLYRRQLLVRPDLPPTTTVNGQYVVPQPNNLVAGQFYQTGMGSPYAYNTNFYAITDLSAHAAGAAGGAIGTFDLSPSPPSFYVVANSLEDLTKRENRFAHYPLVAGTSPYGWPHHVRGWGQFYNTIPFGGAPSYGIFRKFPPANPTSPLAGSVVTSGRLGLPTLRECSSLYFPLPGTFELLNTGQIVLGNASGQGMSSTSLENEPFDAWTNSNPTWTVKLGSTVQGGTADALTGNLLNIFPDNPAPSPFGSRYGEDVILTHVLSFDVRVWDPQAALISVTDSSGNVSLYSPGDPGYYAQLRDWVKGTGPAGTNYAIASRGAYVDLYYRAGFPFFLTVIGDSLTAAQQTALDSVITSTFSEAGNSKSGLQSPDPYTASTYDTGSWHYENDGIDQDGVNGADQGTNGLDDNGDGVVDDVGELEAPPPYSAPLRGIQIKIRCFDADSQEIREVTVVQEFVPE